ncbi:putative PKS-like protein biosynthetic cluster, partial [Neopestalotiopsis sp. 37M]
MDRTQVQQEPVAIVGFACRLPGGNHTPQKLWDFLEEGRVAPNTVPESRFNIRGHYDGSLKPGTMRPKGGMFLSDEIDLAKFDAEFFGFSGADAVATDPNQRQMLEIVYEGLENAGITLEDVDGRPVACYVGSYATDYLDMQNRDAEDRPPNILIGPSITLDTACSGSIVGLDLACKSLQLGEVNMAIIAASNLYINPDHVMDIGSVGGAHSPTALCHTFDADADGYVKAEAVSCIIVKKLSDAIRDGDPVRAIVRGTASNSNGRTVGVGGIAAPNSVAQAAAIRAAYANAGITDLNQTSYLECHGTGTPAGDPTEVKSNLGHSEPAAGISGIIKIALAMERGLIPGNPTFLRPSPKIDFARNRVRASRTSLMWPTSGYSLRRASINSFGYGGSNAHAVLEQPDQEAARHHTTSFGQEQDFDDSPQRFQTLVVSANDASSLKANISALCNHIANPLVTTSLSDLAYTLSERRSRLWHRAFVTIDTSDDLDEANFTITKGSAQTPKVAFVFTGQGAQWPQMGKDLLTLFPKQTIPVLDELDAVLQAQPDPPQWSLKAELSQPRTAEHLRQPEFSQPLVTALQLCLIVVLDSWGIQATAVVGHSSGEIAAAYAAGLLDRAGAIKAAFYRGRAAVNCKTLGLVQENVGMLAVGLGAEALSPFLERHTGNAWIACYNSPNSVTVSGEKATLETLASEIKTAGHFARILQVDLAYHSPLMGPIGEEYERLLNADPGFNPTTAKHERLGRLPRLFSSVTMSEKTTSANAAYWKGNMVSPVHFAGALESLVTDDAPTVLVELGPSGALAGPVSQVLQSESLSSGAGADASYVAAWSRGTDAARALMSLAGRLFLSGVPIDLAQANAYDSEQVRVIVDLPNYQWNHSVRYWHENAASSDWRNKRFITHDLLGSKLPGTSWKSPTWRKVLRLGDVPWLRDHRMGPDVLIPGTAFISMALEAIFQKHCATQDDEAGHLSSPNQLAYRFRNVKFDRAVVVEDAQPTNLVVTLASLTGSQEWHEFRIRTTTSTHDIVYEHCSGLVRVHDKLTDDEYGLSGEQLAPLKHPQSPAPWYKLQTSVGTHFGPAFQKIKQWESVSGQHHCRAIMSLEPPISKYNPQTYYPIHPAVLDACLQTSTPAILAGERTTLQDVMILASIDDMVINTVPRDLGDGLSVANAVWTGRGRKDKSQSWASNVDIHDPQTGSLFLRVRGLEHVRLDVPEKPDVHHFNAVCWNPDMSRITQDQVLYNLGVPDQGTQLDAVIDLIAHKTPRLRVLEVDLQGERTSGAWLEPASEASLRARAAYEHYDFVSPNAQAVVEFETAQKGAHKAQFHLLSPGRADPGLPASILEASYDLILLWTAKPKTTEPDALVTQVKSLIGTDGFMLSLPTYSGKDVPIKWQSDDDLVEVSGDGSADSESRTPSDSDNERDSPSSSPVLVKWQSTGYTTPVTGTKDVGDIEDPVTNGPVSNDTFQALTVPSVLGIGSAPGYIYRNNTSNSSQVSNRVKSLVVAQFEGANPPLGPGLRGALTASGWLINTAQIEDLTDEISGINQTLSSASVVLVIDELVRSVLADISSSRWESLKRLIASGKPLLWVTRGAQTENVSSPDNALVQGLFRVVRREDPGVRLVTLDVQSPASAAAHWAVQQVLATMAFGLDTRTGSAEAAIGETEYAERDGLLLIPRIVPDNDLNEFRAAERGAGHRLVEKYLHANPAQVRLQADKIGTLDSLKWCETATGQVAVETGKVEIEVMAVGVNFKDVATTMGIVPENEHMIGCECAGYIKRIGPGVTGFNIGDRVVAQTNGTYVNRLQCVADRVYPIPASLSFEDAATIPLVYLTAIYALFHMADLKEGQTVLIHSAAGGVGIAAIQLAKFKKADIYVTVGTEDKRKFLADKFGIAPNRMFSSRDTRFAEQIRRETGGRGIDVILNSLIGELLDESWRLTADGGTMVEIGKRDIVNRNRLAMEPFDRNCSYRAIDLSYVRNISDQLIGRLLKEVFDLVGAGHIGPIQPVTVYGFEEVISALSYIRRGQHIGKIVVSNGNRLDVKVLTKPAMHKLELKPDVAYLIVGGLKGLCGSLAVHMARHGARHIITMSRSGAADPASAKVIDDCCSYGCQVTDAQGDVCDKDFVAQVFRQSPRIAGVIQAAMILRDKPYEIMTHDDYHTAIKAKVTGTWNLHNVALREQPLDFFTMLSSVSGVVGNKGQANYAAANAFLDAFGYFRRSQGLHANTVDLGLIEDVGYVAETGGAALEARFDRSEWTPIDEGVLRRILGYSIMQQNDLRAPLSAAGAAQLVTGIAYPLSSGTSDLAAERRFGYLFAAGDGGKSQGHGGQGDEADQAVRAFHMMRAADTDERALTKAAVELLQKQIAKLLRLESEIEPGKPLMAYGLDSLSAVELRGWIRQKLGGE